MNTSFFTQSIQLTLSILLQHHILKLFSVLLSYCLKCPSGRNVENQSDKRIYDTHIPQNEVAYISYLITRIIIIWWKNMWLVTLQSIWHNFSPLCSYSFIAYRLFHKHRPHTVGLVTRWKWMDDSFKLRPTLSLWTPIIICSFGRGSDDETTPSRQR
jgi:hypothetical protein